ncbi:DUF1837 domain-containing protein [Pseudomonas syringae]|uniref:HamA C-terminal domain-containing protein n=1 Tax=Pseudomonas syringae TaxID=317 RepID=UPI00320B2AE2
MSSSLVTGPSLTEVIDKLLNQSPLNEFVKCVQDLHAQPADLSPKLALLHVRFQEDIPNTLSLADFLSSQAVNYALSRRRRDAYMAQLASGKNGDLSLTSQIHKAVKNAFIQFRKEYPSRASEVGEVLAYCIAVHHLNAAQLVAKMSLKTSTNMPVHGLDGIHASVKDGLLHIFFLESKLAGTAASGTADYAESIAGFGSNKKQYLQEYGLARDLGNLDALPQADKDRLMEYLDVFNSPNAPKRERSVGVICYSESQHFANKLPVDDGALDKHELHFGNLYANDHKRHHKNVSNQLEKHGVDANKCMLYLVAVPDVDELRELFYDSLGILPAQSDTALTVPSPGEDVSDE